MRWRKFSVAGLAASGWPEVSYNLDTGVLELSYPFHGAENCTARRNSNVRRGSQSRRRSFKCCSGDDFSK